MNWPNWGHRENAAGTGWRRYSIWTVFVKKVWAKSFMIIIWHLLLSHYMHTRTTAVRRDNVKYAADCHVNNAFKLLQLLSFFFIIFSFRF